MVARRFLIALLTLPFGEAAFANDSEFEFALKLASARRAANAKVQVVTPVPVQPSPIAPEPETPVIPNVPTPTATVQPYTFAPPTCAGPDCQQQQSSFRQSSGWHPGKLLGR